MKTKAECERAEDEILDVTTTTMKMACGGRLIVPAIIQRSMALKTGTMVEVTIKALDKNRSPTAPKRKATVTGTGPDADEAKKKAAKYLTEVAIKKKATAAASS